MATPPVDERGADGTDQRERSDEDSGVHRRLHTDVADPTGAVAEVDSLAAMAAEQLDQEGAGDVETLGHRVVHRRIEVHPLTGDVAQTGTHAAGGDHEDRQNRNGQQGELPLEQQHRDERAAERDGVADHRAERAGEGPLGTDDVIVQPADECAGLGAGEEGDRHPLDVVEQLHPKVVDQALTDPTRQVALDESEHRFAERGGDHEEEEDVQVAAVAVEDGIVEDLPDQQRRQQAEEGRGDDRSEEADDRGPIGPGERHDTPAGLLGEFLAIEHGPVGRHRVHHHERAGSIHQEKKRTPRRDVLTGPATDRSQGHKRRRGHGGVPLG